MAPSFIIYICLAQCVAVMSTSILSDSHQGSSIQTIPLLMVHGVLGSVLQLAPKHLTALTRKKFHVVAVSLPGYVELLLA